MSQALRIHADLVASPHGGAARSSSPGRWKSSGERIGINERPAQPERAERRYTWRVSTANDIYRELLGLPEQERLRLVERVIHDLADAAKRRAASPTAPAGSSVIGLWADEPELVDQMIEGALRQRETRRLRTTDDASLDG